MLRKTSLYTILAVIIGVVIMLTPLTLISSQQLAPGLKKVAPLPAKETQGAEIVKIERMKQFNVIQSTTSIILILALSLIPALIISTYIKKRIS